MSGGFTLYTQLLLTWIARNMNKAAVIRGAGVNIYYDLCFVSQVGNLEELALANPRVTFCERIATYLNVLHIGWAKIKTSGEP